MTIRKTMLAALVLTLPAAGASAQQEPWTLDRCIEYAVENNISIQQFRLRAEAAAADAPQDARRSHAWLQVPLP